jgi:helicase associated protein
MPSTRAARLESLPGWDWGGVLAGRWEQAFALLAEYAAAGGTARVKVSGRDPTDGFALGQWAANQRGSFARGKMPRDRAARLEALPGWVWDAR